jgi:hypothetical protein
MAIEYGITRKFYQIVEDVWFYGLIKPNSISSPVSFNDQPKN